MIELTLPYPISANRYWRSYVPRGCSRAFVVLSEEAKAYRREVGWIARQAGIRSPLLGRIALSYVLHPKRPQDWERRSRKDPARWEESVQCMDLLNANKVLCDALNGIVYPDDKWIWEARATRGEPQEKGCVVVQVGVIEAELSVAA